MSVEETLARFFGPAGSKSPDGPGREPVRYEAQEPGASLPHGSGAYWLHTGWGAYPHGDDGHDFADLVGASWFDDPDGWVTVPEAGDWPYSIWFYHAGGHALMHYCEGDLLMRVYDTEHGARNAVKATVADHPAR